MGVMILADKKDFYEILGVSRDADEREIKKAYRRLAKKYHPDTNSGNAQAEQRFKEITEAYTILSDREKRTLYDRYGHTAFEGNNDSGFHFEEQNMDDLFGDLFGRMFGSSGFRQSRFDGYQSQGADLRSEITVTFDEAVFGCTKILHLQNGAGGYGVQSLLVKIPAGIDDGMNIRLRKKGMPGAGGTAGDLLLKVHVEKRPGFERKGLDIYTSVTIPYTIAAAGGKVQIPTVDGRVEFRIQKGVQSGTRIRLRGKGVTSVKNHAVRGDQYVTVRVRSSQDKTVYG